MSLPALLGLVYLASEIALMLLKRSRGTGASADGGSLGMLWAGIGIGVAMGIFAAHRVPSLSYPLPPVGARLLMGIFAAGLAVRWWAILTLGRFFTVDVAISRDHRVVTHGPFRFVRHPSYAGMMIAFAALAATFQNALGFFGMLVPIAIALAYRIRIEERALHAALGEDYTRYAAKTKRLIPGVL